MSRNLLVPILIGFMLVSTGQSQAAQNLSSTILPSSASSHLPSSASSHLPSSASSHLPSSASSHLPSSASSQVPVNASQVPVNASQVPVNASQVPVNASQVPVNGSTQLPPLPGNGSIPSLSGNISRDLGVLPDGRRLNNLTGQFIVANGSDGDWSKVVANNQSVYVLHPVQDKNTKQIYDPYTIGQVLGYIYEVHEFGGIRPANGYTIELMGKPIPGKVKRSPLPPASSNVKDHRASLIFKRRVPIRDAEDGRR